MVYQGTLKKEMIKKKILSEIALYFGSVKMPKEFEIERENLVKDIMLSSYYENLDFPYSNTFEKLKTFIADFMRVEHKLDLITRKSYGNFYEKNETSRPILEINPMDLRNSPDFVLLYGVEIEPKTCEIIISYDDNRRKGKNWRINLENNKFVMFPASQSFYIKNNKNSYLNFIQTITFEYL